MKRLLFLLLLLPVFADGQLASKSNEYELNIYFMEDFKDTFKVYLNEVLISKSQFVTDESTASCHKYLSVKVQKDENHLVVKSTKNKTHWEVYIPYNPSDNHLYLRRYAGVWKYKLSDKLNEVK